MKKIAVMTDSNSGISPMDGKEMGIAILPMPFMIDNRTYYENLDLTQEEFYEKLESGAQISTSQPSPQAMMQMWDALLKDNDQIVHIPMSSGLSGSCQTAMMLSMEEKYEGRVFVVNNQRISVTQRSSVADALRLVREGKDGGQIKDILEQDKFHSTIYIMLDTLHYLKQGGRITPAAAALGTLLRIKPVLTIQGEKLDAFAKARTAGQGKSLMVNAVKADIENRFGGLSPDNFTVFVAYSKDAEAAGMFRQEVEEAFGVKNIIMDPLSLSVSCHIGSGALAVAAVKNL